MVGIGFGVFSILGWLWAGAKAKSSGVWRAVLVWAVVTTGLFFSIFMAGSDKTSIWNGMAGIKQNGILGRLLRDSWLASAEHLV